MRPFDPLHSPLEGTCLIEAGAGTGKTHTITTLVLRLILEHALTVEQILVMTFTTAATAELRDRLRRRLREAKYMLSGRGAGNAELESLLASAAPREIALRRLEDALANFDRLPVFTIHGFCQRILSEMAFETGGSFDAELVTDTRAIVQGLAEDFWRRTWYRESPEVMALARKRFKSPAELADIYCRYAVPDIDLLPEDEVPQAVSCEVFRDLWAEAGRQWVQDREALLQALASADLKANVYGRPDPPADRPGDRSPRGEKLASWAGRMDRWLRSPAAGFPPPDALLYFSRSKLETSLKKGALRPQHPFFETCERVRQESRRLEAEMDRWLTLLQVRFFRYVEEALSQIKQEKQVVFFDDLLLMVRHALAQDDGGVLQRILRSRYRAALIDEFQDTDAVQYAIFDTLFGAGHLMFMIGDPKQAIYSFRGADIFTYLDAARKVDHGYTLTCNWRSTPEMVRAVNLLFSRAENPFLWPAIAFRPASAARAADAETPADPALTIWYVAPPDAATGRAAWNKPPVFKAVGRALAQEVARLQGQGTDCREIAILVRTNRQAREMKGHLSDALIPAVVYNAGSVFHRTEALDLRRILEAVLDPGDDVKLRTALSTPFFGCGAGDLDFSDQVPAWWEALVERFYTYRDLWIAGGFIRMFRRFAVEEKSTRRLLAGPWGERRLTNVRHLVELLHQAAVERRLGPGELIQWLEKQRRRTGDPVETHQIRLESDAEAVTIMTVHKSKGLEFPIVFCPFVWEGMGTVAAPALCHDAQRNGRRVLDFGSADLEKHLAAMAEERMAEELRLLYVALTRAKKRCYVVWGKLPSSAFSALAYLMDAECARRKGSPDWEAIQTMARRYEAQTAGDHRRQTEALVNASEGVIGIIDLPSGDSVDLPTGDHAPVLAPPRPFRRGPLPVWRLASFSSLVQHRSEDSALAGAPVEHQDVQPSPYSGGEIGDRTASIGPIADFEASARAGLFFHEVLESIDFTSPSPDLWDLPVADRLQAHGFAMQWKSPVRALLQRVVHAPLETADGASFALHQIAGSDRLSEMEFHLPLRAFDAGALGRAFAQCRQPAFRDRLPRLVEQLDFSMAGGYLKGYIDLVFRCRGRYYIADWKSNLLGDTYDAYEPGRLADVMASDYYFLQYHLYTLAVDRYLQGACPGYRYEDHFGGIFYCFLRGMGPGHPSGVFYDRPSQALMERLLKVITLNHNNAIKTIS